MRALIAILLLPMLLLLSQTDYGIAAIVKRDELNRLMNSEEAFYINNPPPAGEKSAPIPVIDAYDDWGTTQLIRAVRTNDLEQVTALLQQNAGPNVRSADGITPLEIAAKYADVPMIRLLLAKGADPRQGKPYALAKTDEARTLLEEKGATTVFEKRPARVEIRLNSPEELDAVEAVLEGEKKTGKLTDSLVISVILGRSPERLTELAAHGADVNAVHPLLGTALEQAIRQRRGSTVISCLLKLGADPNLSPHPHTSPLHDAMSDGAETVTLLLDAGARLTPPDPRDTPYLIQAACSGNVALIEILLKAKEDVNLRAEDGKTPLLAACACPHYNRSVEKALRLLLSNGADPKAQDNEGNNALALLPWHRENRDEIMVLLEAGVPVDDKALPVRYEEGTLLHLAITYDDQELFQALLKAKADINRRDQGGTSPLALAVESGKPWFVNELLKAGAPVNNSATAPRDRHIPYLDKVFKARDDMLCRAVYKGDMEVIRLLIAAGVDVNAPTNRVYDRLTPLHVAVDNGRQDIVNALLKAGAKTNSQDNRGRTPLHYAVRMDDVEIVKALLKAGAKPKVRDKDGRSPRDLAREHGEKSDMATLLK